MPYFTEISGMRRKVKEAIDELQKITTLLESLNPEPERAEARDRAVRAAK